MGVAVAAGESLVGTTDGDGVELAYVDVVAVGRMGGNVDGAQANDGAAQQEKQQYHHAHQHSSPELVAGRQLHALPVDILWSWHLFIFHKQCPPLELVVLGGLVDTATAAGAHTPVPAAVVQVVLFVVVQTLGLGLFVLEVHVRRCCLRHNPQLIDLVLQLVFLLHQLLHLLQSAIAQLQLQLLLSYLLLQLV